MSLAPNINQLPPEVLDHVHKQLNYEDGRNLTRTSRSLRKSTKLEQDKRNALLRQLTQSQCFFDQVPEEDRNDVDVLVHAFAGVMSGGNLRESLLYIMGIVDQLTPASAQNIDVINAQLKAEYFLYRQGQQELNGGNGRHWRYRMQFRSNPAGFWPPSIVISGPPKHSAISKLRNDKGFVMKVLKTAGTKALKYAGSKVTGNHEFVAVLNKFGPQNKDNTLWVVDEPLKRAIYTITNNTFSKELPMMSQVHFL